jgi:ectoine hydroxylase-related dioxygenase (phytanoyl-CoA dioxygenase family)
MEAGGFSIHHNKTFHASGPNHGSIPRRSLAIHARTDQSQPVDGVRAGLTEFIDDFKVCPVIYGG